MVYAPRHRRTFSYVMAGLCAGLSLIGFAAAGVIPTASTRDHGAYPLTGWLIVAACAATAFVFLRRGGDARALVRMDERGISAPAYAADVIPWDQIAGLRVFRAGVQQIVRFELSDPDRFAPGGLRGTVGRLDRALSYGHFGINPTFWEPGMDALLATVRHYRPDLFG